MSINVWQNQYSIIQKNKVKIKFKKKEFSTVHCNSCGQRLYVADEADVFLEFPCFFFDPANVGNLISGFSSFSKRSLDIWKFLVHVMLNPSMQDFKRKLTSMGDGCNCLMVSTFFSTTLGNWDED